MIIVLFVIFLALLIFGIWWAVDEYEPCLGLATGLPLIAVIIAAICLITGVVKGRIIDDKIAMYTEENTKIETSIGELVSEYMEFEADTYSEFKNDSAITLVSLYPELKSDELVKIQIETYQENTTKIKELKEDKLDIAIYKWWLYFGG